MEEVIVPKSKAVHIGPEAGKIIGLTRESVAYSCQGTWPVSIAPTMCVVRVSLKDPVFGIGHLTTPSETGVFSGHPIKGPIETPPGVPSTPQDVFTRAAKR